MYNIDTSILEAFYTLACDPWVWVLTGDNYTFNFDLYKCFGSGWSFPLMIARFKSDIGRRTTALFP